MDDLAMERVEDFLKIKKMNIESIEIILNSKIKKVFLLNREFILKIDDAKRLEKEYNFFCVYGNEDIYEKIIYHDFNKGYIVYEYIDGNHIDNIENWKGLVNILKENTNKYKKYNKKYENLFYCNDENWIEFIERKVLENIVYYFPNEEEREILKRAFNKLKEYKLNARIIHGDLGIYNVLISNNNEVKIIDPYPMVGDPNYDILTFFCSSIKILDYFGVDYIIKFLYGNKKKNLYLFIVVLYLRICIESKHKKESVNRYKEKLKEIIKMEESL